MIVNKLQKVHNVHYIKVDENLLMKKSKLLGMINRLYR